MGCSSCQQNNHIVPTNVTHAHATTHCECACGCSEPICPTPQPCTEITDSKCIIYTDLPIKCGNETIVTTNASVSTALNQIVAYFCGQMVPVVTEDVICGDTKIVPAGSTLEESVIAIVNWVCQLDKEIADVQDIITAINSQLVTLNACCDSNTETNLVQGEQIAVLQVCCDQNTEVNALQSEQIEALQNQVNALVPHYKFVHEETSVFDGDAITITRQALEYCNILPPACSTDLGFVDKVCDLQVSVYYLFNGSWLNIPQRPFGSPAAQGYDLAIDETTGDISVILSIAPIDPAVTVRVVILA